LLTLFNENLDIDSTESPPADPPASPQPIFAPTALVRKGGQGGKLATSQSFKHKTSPSAKPARTKASSKAIAPTHAARGSLNQTTASKLGLDGYNPDETIAPSNSTMESSGSYFPHGF
jgi:hypothetical protein